MARLANTKPATARGVVSVVRAALANGAAGTGRAGTCPGSMRRRTDKMSIKAASRDRSAGQDKQSTAPHSKKRSRW